MNLAHRVEIFVIVAPRIVAELSLPKVAVGRTLPTHGIDHLVSRFIPPSVRAIAIVVAVIRSVVVVHHAVGIVSDFVIPCRRALPENGFQDAHRRRAGRGGIRRRVAAGGLPRRRGLEPELVFDPFAFGANDPLAHGREIDDSACNRRQARRQRINRTDRIRKHLNRELKPFTGFAHEVDVQTLHVVYVLRVRRIAGRQFRIGRNRILDLAGVFGLLVAGFPDKVVNPIAIMANHALVVFGKVNNHAVFLGSTFHGLQVLGRLSVFIGFNAKIIIVASASNKRCRAEGTQSKQRNKILFHHNLLPLNHLLRC